MEENQKTLSVIIPTWSATHDLMEMALALAKQVRPMCDELVITEDGYFSAELKAIADQYLIHKRLGHGQNLNLGFQASTGDFVAIMDSDIVLTSGTLRDLCIPNTVCVPNNLTAWGWFFVSARSYIEEYPPFDLPGPEGIDHWWRAFQERVKEVTVRSDKVGYEHLRNRSYDILIRQRQEDYHKNQPARKEVDPHRHKSRLLEDPEYAKLWSNEEEAKGKEELRPNP